MTVKRIIQEAIAENPIGLKEALSEELRGRVALALETKISESTEELDEGVRGLFQKIKPGDHVHYNTGDKSDPIKKAKVVGKNKGGELVIDHGDGKHKYLYTSDVVKHTVKEELELDENFEDGDKVHWYDPDHGKKHSGEIVMKNALTRKGIKHAKVRINNSHGTTVNVPHKYLNKMTEEIELDEISGATLGSYYVKARKSRDAENEKARSVLHGAKDVKDAKDVEAANNQYVKHNKKANNRLYGMNNAMNKLTGSSFAKIHTTESFVRGDILHVPGEGGSKHPAVHLGKKAVYLDDDGAVEHVPDHALANSEKAKRVPAKHKELAKKYLENMKEDATQLDELSIDKLKAYHKAAKGDADTRSIKHAEGTGEKGNIKKFLKRKAGMDLATWKAGKKTIGEETQLDEISKEKLGAYIKRANLDAANHAVKTDRLTRMAYSGDKSRDEFEKLSDASDKAYKKQMNRVVGIGRATNKLTKEETELTELSKKTLGSYIRKASANAADNAHAVGKKQADSDDVDRFTNRHMNNQFGHRETLKKAMGADSDSINSAHRTMRKRIRGINKATEKLTKEETEE